MVSTINTDMYSARLRNLSIDVKSKSVLLSVLRGSEQEVDLSEPVNCDGLGRVRHFRRNSATGWPRNPLPLDPACKSLGLRDTDILRAQAFQNAACNWRCWYCFVPFSLLSADPKHSRMVKVNELLDLYENLPNRPCVIDLTGGQPDLIPEWVSWMLDEIKTRNLGSVYLWSDDNLSNDYFWRFLTENQIAQLASARNYGRVACFKGFDEASFSFNTRAESSLFGRQFLIFRRLMETRMDLYAYATFTGLNASLVGDNVRRFVDRLQQIATRLPLRTIPLRIQLFSPVQRRLTDENRCALAVQEAAIEVWNKEIETRFTSTERAKSVVDINLLG